MKTQLRAVIFDMDGVLCDSEPVLLAAATRMFREKYKTEVRASDFTEFVGTGEDRYLEGVAEKHGLTLDMPADKERTYALYMSLIPGRLQPVRGAKEFVARLEALEFRLAVATSADRVKMKANLEEIGLPPERFHACITGSETARKKPAPDIFLKACQALDVPSGRALVVEDATTGVRAARAANCRTLGITTNFTAEELREAGAHWTAPDFTTLPDELREHLGVQEG